MKFKLLIFKVIFFAAGLTLIVNDATSTPVNGSKLELYIQAEREALYGNTERFKQLSDALLDYPLLPYAQAEDLKRRLKIENKAEIHQFLEAHDNTPYAESLHAKWLDYLRQHNHQQEFLNVYTPTTNAELACTYLTWQLGKGESIESLHQQIKSLWLVAYSQPKDCDLLFKQWQTAGYLTEPLVLKRIELAAKATNLSLLPYLKSLLSNGNRHLVGLWKTAVEKPWKATKANFFLFYTQAEKDIFLYLVHRLVYQNPQDIEAFWERLAPRFNLSNNEKRLIDKKLALAYTVAEDERGWQRLLQLPDAQVDESVKQWRLAYSLQHSTEEKINWQQTYQVLNELPEHMQTDIAVLYWKARALDKIGKPQEAKRIYAELAERRNYYGFLAATALNKSQSLRHEPLVVQPSVLRQVADMSRVQRAKALFKLNRVTAARKEWNRLLPLLNKEQTLAAAKLAYDWGWYDRPIFMLAKMGYMNDVELRFPLAYQHLVSSQAQQQQLDPAFAFAITRRESAFMYDAYSSQGATGLMQIKPSTASYVANKTVKRSQLLQPESNVNYGIKYLSYLLKKTQGHPVLTAAAYNAGYNKVKQWLPEQPIATDIWIETIPYKETRNYVKAVMAYSHVYQQRLKQRNNIFNSEQASIITP